MTEPDYRAALAAAIAEYERLGSDRQRIDERLTQLAHTIGTLTRLLGLVPTHPLGLTEACRLVYRNAGVPLSPTEARDRLRAIGVDLSVYSSEMAAIHTVVKRLHEAGELRRIGSPAGKVSFVWQRPVRAEAVGAEVAQFIRQGGTFHVAPGVRRPRRRPARVRR
jgi:hypothetical protein